MKKVLYVSPNGYLGGAERFVLTAVKAHSMGNKVSASILFYSKGEAFEEAKLAGLECHLLTQNFRFRYPWKLFAALMEIRSLVKKINPEIIHLTMPYSQISISLAIMGLGIKKVWFQHGPVGGELDRFANIFPVDVILYNCVDLKNRHHLTLPRARVKLDEKIINYGVNPSKHNHVLFTNQPLSLGTAGRICSWKGFHNIITAIGELKKEGGLRPFKLKMAGSAKMAIDLAYKDSLKDLVMKYNLNNEIEFLDHVKDMELYYQSIDVFIHASIIPEPFGLVVAEAMVNGCVVIASDTGGVKDLIENGVNGYNFPATSENAVSELKNVLRSFLSEKLDFPKENLVSMAAKGKKLILENYSIEKMNNQLENLYLNI